MRGVSITPHGIDVLRRRWLSLKGRTRLGVGLIVVLVAGFLTYSVLEWWTSWPARLVLQGPEWHYPLAYSPDGSILATRRVREDGLDVDDSLRFLD